MCEEPSKKVFIWVDLMKFWKGNFNGFYVDLVFCCWEEFDGIDVVMSFSFLAEGCAFYYLLFVLERDFYLSFLPDEVILIGCILSIGKTKFAGIALFYALLMLMLWSWID